MDLSVFPMKRFFIAVMGGTVLIIGILMIVLPGPAILVIPAGLAILATEFVWARHWLKQGRAFGPRWKAARANGQSRWAAFRAALAPPPPPAESAPRSNSPADNPANPP
jgi:hypothetical protein